MSHRPQHLHLVSDPLPAALEETPDDRAREKRIEQLQAEYKKHAAFGPMATAKCAEIFEQIRTEVMARSPDQVERMERARGLCPR